MAIELPEEDIVKEVSKNYKDDVNFLFRLVDNGTSTWEPFKELFKLMANNMINNGESPIEVLDELTNS